MSTRSTATSIPSNSVYAGRKVCIPKPRVRAKESGELTLQSYLAFQQDGRMQRAVARQLTHQVSTRNYAAEASPAVQELIGTYLVAGRLLRHGV